MAGPSARVEMERLLDHAQWVQELARRLVRDPDQAEDLAQDVLVAALESPVAVRSQRAWLAGVLRNRARELIRSRVRRADRELSTARPIETDSTADRVARMSAHKDVVAHVLDLPEHYRDTLLRRYFDGQSPKRIAAETGVPVATVKTRLQRGIEALRERLDQAHGGDGQAWLAALMPLVHAPLRTVPPAATSSSTALGSLATLAVPVVLAGLLVGYLAHRMRGTAPQGAPETAPLALAEPDGASSGPARLDESSRRTQLDALPEPTQAGARQLARAFRGATVVPVRGSVLDVDGQALAGVVVRFESDRRERNAGVPIGFSGPAGEFELQDVVGSGLVRAAGDWVTVFAGRLGVRDPGDPGERAGIDLVVAPSARVTGSVIGPDGAPRAGVDVALELSSERAAALASLLPCAAAMAFRTRTDEAGAFEFERAPRVPGLVVRAGRLDEPGASATSSLSGHVREAVVLQLGASAAEQLFRGRVLDPAGVPLAGAEVWLVRGSWSSVARSAEDGGFELGMHSAGTAEGEPGYQLRAFAVGRGSLATDLSAEQLAAPCDLRLEPLASLSGRVLDTAGNPVPWVSVWIADPTLMVWSPAPRGRSWLLGRRTDEARERAGAGVLEAAAIGESDTWHRVSTDADGHFVLAGLSPRSYELQSVDQRALTRAELRVQAGEADVELVLEPLQLSRRLAGRVLTPDGQPVAGVRVSYDLPALVIEREDEVGYAAAYSIGVGTSDTDGRFWIEGLPLTVTRLQVGGAGILADSIEVEPDSADELLLEVVLRAALQISLRDPQRADEFAVLDADGEPLPLWRKRGLDERLYERAPLRAGQSESLTTDARAVRVLLYLDGVEVASESIELEPGGRQRFEL